MTVSPTPELDVEIWREHEQWLEQRPRRQIERERWTAAEWLAAKQSADAAWVSNPSGLYVYAAEYALRKVAHRRIEKRLAAEAAHGPSWLCGLLERRAV